MGRERDIDREEEEMEMGRERDIDRGEESARERDEERVTDSNIETLNSLCACRRLVRRIHG